MLNFIRKIKMIDYSSKRTQKTYILYIVFEAIISLILALISVNRYNKIKKLDKKEEIDEESFEAQTAKIQDKNIKMWCAAGIVLWISGIFAMFKMDYTTLGEWWDKHFN